MSAAPDLRLLTVRAEDACLELSERFRAYEALSRLLDLQSGTPNGAPSMDISARDLAEMVRLLNESMQDRIAAVRDTLARLQQAACSAAAA